MIIGVAIRLETGIFKLPKPHRHSDCFQQATQQGLDVSFAVKASNQGFYTESCEFLDREEAMRFVKEAGQKLMPDWQTGEVNESIALFSEDLW